MQVLKNVTMLLTNDIYLAFSSENFKLLKDFWIFGFCNLSKKNISRHLWDHPSRLRFLEPYFAKLQDNRKLCDNQNMKTIILCFLSDANRQIATFEEFFSYQKSFFNDDFLSDNHLSQVLSSM